MVPCVTLLTATEPKVAPKMDVSPDDSVWYSAVLPASAAVLSELVKATEFSTMAEPEVTLLMVTLTRALILARMFVSRTWMNCSGQALWMQL